MADDEHPLRAVAIVRRRQPSPQRRRHTQRGKEIPGRDDAIQAHRVAGPDERCGLRGVGRQPFERAAGALPVEEVRRRDFHPRVAAECLVLVQLYQATGLWEWQRPDQHVVGNAEGDGGGADAQGRDEDGGDGKPGRSPYRAHGGPQVLPEQVGVNHRCVHDDIANGSGPERQPLAAASDGAPRISEDRGHLVTVFGAERLRVEP